MLLYYCKGETKPPSNTTYKHSMNGPKHEPRRGDPTMKKYTITNDEKKWLSDGNEKLKPNEKVKFLIWNLPAIKTCPFRTALCEKFCYARKAEMQYKNVCPQRRHMNLNASLYDDFVANMVRIISYHITNRPTFRKAKKVVVRIHESGDFYSREYAKKWLAIAKHFQDNDKIVFMAYTKSVEFFKGEDIPKNMVVRFSLWDDTDMKQAMISAMMGLPIYTAVEKFTDEPKIERCSCVDCGTCGKCWNKNIKTLKCEIH